MKRYLRIFLLLLLFAGGGYGVYHFFFKGGGSASADVWAFVPDDFIYVIESDKPIEDWQSMSGSKVWKYLKTHPYFADITESADYLDELLTTNKTITSMVRMGGCLISAHMTGPKTYDFVILADLKGNSDVGSTLMPVLSPIIESQGYKLSDEKYFNYTLYNMHDPKADDTFTFGFIGKVLVGSYSKALVKKAIAQTESKNVIQNADLNYVQGKLDRNGQYSIYMNYSVFDRFVLSYTDAMPSMMQDFNQILKFSAFDFNMTDSYVKLAGVTKQNDSIPSYLTIFGDAGQGEIHAPSVLPANTAMYMSLGFGKFSDFYSLLMKQVERESPEEYKELVKRQKQAEKLLGFDFEGDMFDWVTDEIVTAVVPLPNVPDSTGTAATTEDGGSYAYYAMLHFNNGDLAREKMDLLAKRIKNRAGLGGLLAKFDDYKYKEYDIRYMKSGLVMNLFFKKMFDKIEKPHYAFVGDYLVFTNDTVSMHRLIDAYIGEQTLEKSETYRNFASNFENESNVWMYIQNQYFFDYMRKDLDLETRTTLDRSREYLMSFPQIGFQLYPGSGLYNTTLYGEFVPLK